MPEHVWLNIQQLSLLSAVERLMSSTVLAIFVPTFFSVPLTPGLCMALLMTMRMTVGMRRTLWMMYGELLGAGLVAAASVIGVAPVMLQYPAIFSLVKYLGGFYLRYLGIQMWLSRDRMAIKLNTRVNRPYRDLSLQLPIPRVGLPYCAPLAIYRWATATVWPTQPSAQHYPLH